MPNTHYKILIPEKKSGGVETYSLELYRQMISQKRNVELLYLDELGAGKTIFHSFLKIKSILRKIPKDVVTISHGQYGLIALFRTNILIIHGNPLDYFFAASPLRRKLRFRSILLMCVDYVSDLIAIKFSKKIIFVSEHVKKSFQYILGSRNKIYVNHSMKYDFEECIKRDVKYFSIISNATYEKGLDRLNTLVNSYKLQCDVAGISDIGDFENLKFLGRITAQEIKNLNKNHSTLIHLSRYEGLPLVVLEALSMSCRCIVIKSEWSNFFIGLRSVLILEEENLNYSTEIEEAIKRLNNLDISLLKSEYLKLIEKIKAIHEAI